MPETATGGVRKKGCSKKFRKFTAKDLCECLFFNKVAGQLATLLKTRLWHRHFRLLIFLLRHFRSSSPEVFCIKGIHRNFGKFTRKRLCQSLFFNKVANWPATLLKKRHSHRSFPVNFSKFLRTPLLTNTSGDCYWHFQTWCYEKEQNGIIVPT